MDNSENECGICLNDVNKSCFAFIDCGCQQEYHINCAKLWLNRKKTCPVCYAAVTHISIEDERNLIVLLPIEEFVNKDVVIDINEPHSTPHYRKKIPDYCICLSVSGVISFVYLMTKLM